MKHPGRSKKTGINRSIVRSSLDQLSEFQIPLFLLKPSLRILSFFTEMPLISGAVYRGNCQKQLRPVLYFFIFCGVFTVLVILQLLQQLQYDYHQQCYDLETFTILLWCKIKIVPVIAQFLKFSSTWYHPVFYIYAIFYYICSHT